MSCVESTMMYRLTSSRFLVWMLVSEYHCSMHILHSVCSLAFCRLLCWSVGECVYSTNYKYHFCELRKSVQLTTSSTDSTISRRTCSAYIAAHCYNVTRNQVMNMHVCVLQWHSTGELCWINVYIVITSQLAWLLSLNQHPPLSFLLIVIAAIK